MTSWIIYTGSRKPHKGIGRLPKPPRWRSFTGDPIEFSDLKGEKDPHYISSGEDEVTLVNAALYLRRPLLVTGKPGSGKSSLARAVAYELQLGQVLYWPITSRSTLLEGLYSYDAVGRLQEAHLLELEGEKCTPDIGKYIRLGPLGTALLPTNQPRVLLIDEIDKSDIDLPNDLLHVFEEGQYEIPRVGPPGRNAARRSTHPRWSESKDRQWEGGLPPIPLCCSDQQPREGISAAFPAPLHPS